MRLTTSRQCRRRGRAPSLSANVERGPVRLHWFAVLAAITVVSGAAAAPPVEVTVAPKVVVDAPARPLTFPGRVLAYQGVSYAARPGYRPLTLDLYVPPRAGTRTRLPLVIYIHGGGWQGGNPRLSGAMSDFPAVLASLARRGYVVASLSYRLSSEAKFPAAAIDIRSGIRWLKNHSSQYGIDIDRVGVWGASAGGQLAGLAATACDDPAFDDPTPGTRPVSPCVQAAVTWYGVFDFSTIAEQAEKISGVQPHQNPSSGEARYLGCTLDRCPPELLRLASPIAHVDRNDPQMLLIAGTADQTVPPAQSRTMSDALSKAGVPTQLILIPDVGHSFIGKTPADTRTATLTAVNATFGFFDRVLKGR